ncbi:MAG TPA: 3'(2'),5'-bisphosphate nucleotidase CysQ [Dongiaceae bacterium]|jgi:3'(2'), 5'-bisphosphate nucleotidase
MPSPSFAIDETLLRAVEDIAERAGAVIMDHYSGQTAVTRKADSSPVTEADEAAERAILPALGSLTPGVPIVSEEAVAKGNAPDRTAIAGAGRFWLVDPLDGTREFINRNGEFTVNIALIESGLPVLGVVHLPALAVTYGGIAGHAAEMKRDGRRRAIAARRMPEGGAIVLSSRSHGDDTAMQSFLRETKVDSWRVAGSALKFCQVAEGIADLYPRLGRTMEWDTAAGHAVVLGAGGSVTRLDGGELRYGKENYENPHFVARGAV